MFSQFVVGWAVSAVNDRHLAIRALVMALKRRCPAVMESFFSSVQSELRDRFDSCGEAKMELFDYIEVFYKQRRRHSTLGQISPREFEQLAARHLFLPAKRTGRTAIT